MSEEEELGEEESEKGGGNTVVLAMLGVNMLAVLGIGAYIMLGDKTPPPAAAVAEGEVAAVTVNSNQPGPKWGIEKLIINLREPEGNKYLKLSIEFELANEESFEIAEKEAKQIHALANEFFSDITMDETSGSRGRRGLADRLVRMLNGNMERYARGEMFRSAYFPEFVVH